MLPMTLHRLQSLMGAALFLAGFAIAPTLIATLTLTEQTVPRARLTEGIAVIHTGIVAGVAPGAALAGSSSTPRAPRPAYLVAVGAGLVGARGRADPAALPPTAEARRRALRRRRGAAGVGSAHGSRPESRNRRADEQRWCSLTLVGLSEDGVACCSSTTPGSEFTLGVDARLRAALRGEHARIGQLEIQMDSVLRPRDIQTRIRAGETPEAVAAAAKTTRRQDHAVRRPRARRARARGAARPARLVRAAPAGRRRGHGASRTLGDAVAGHLRALNVDPGGVDWDAWRREDGRWTLTATYEAGRATGAAALRVRRPGQLRRRPTTTTPAG